MTAYCTSSDAVNGMICLSAWNSPPKSGFNRCVVIVNVPFSGCVTSVPQCEKTLVTVKVEVANLARPVGLARFARN